MKNYILSFFMLIAFFSLSGCGSSESAQDNVVGGVSNEEEIDWSSESDGPEEQDPALAADEYTVTSSSKTSLEEQDKITEITDDQKSLLIAWAQMDCEDRGYELKSRGTKAWNVATNYIDGKNNWIVSTQDENHGRVKAIYEWDGDPDSGALPTYLLVGGNELISKQE